ncbi:hypothetical protein Bcav_3159 [Beutenbergia cavernae DSM 12333]|uniref:Uncharacterized protein n=1 Tax=Beutenbergia cavernae (strain ATCC BAA-8 / DSM 12333 / CCUG 43141 / JCM 11478 / NBRC 16432 / NCIMB 13614 / HKI 0122) TaxID=471853 RepID=C5C0K7_BEUC1|nr:hypothetical protein [Beutenbergia cavernae]ACQ81403.1 hypothetical protein Bcav_3159 [Beutenbergia cavernae DSM 12333]
MTTTATLSPARGAPEAQPAQRLRTGAPAMVGWQALSALGAGLVAFACGAELASSSAMLAAVATLALGAGAVCSALATLATGRVVRPRTVAGLAAGSAAVWAAAYALAPGALLVLVPSATLPGSDDAAAIALLLLTAWCSARSVRHVPRGARPAGGPRTLAALTIGALLVAAVTTAGLAATDAGELAVPHGHTDHGGHG